MRVLRSGLNLNAKQHQAAALQQVQCTQFTGPFHCRRLPIHSASGLSGVSPVKCGAPALTHSRINHICKAEPENKEGLSLKKATSVLWEANVRIPF
eukprot:490822-Pelagomonas_calceolata.AAC.1